MPKKYRFSGTEVVVKHFGNGVLLLPVDDPWKTLEAGLAAFEPGFVLTRAQPPAQQRPLLDENIDALIDASAPASTAAAGRP